MFFAHSSPHCLANRDGDNINSGVPVDKEMPIATTYVQGIIPMPIVTEFYNFTEIGECLSIAYVVND